MRGVRVGVILAPSVAACFALCGVLLARNIIGNRLTHSSRVEQTKKAGAELIDSLESYKKDMGRYPEALSDLIPKHLGRIPEPTYGTGKWVYASEEDGNAFWLGAGYNDIALLQGGREDDLYPVLYWQSSKSKWYLSE